MILHLRPSKSPFPKGGFRGNVNVFSREILTLCVSSSPVFRSKLIGWLLGQPISFGYVTMITNPRPSKNKVVCLLAQVVGVDDAVEVVDFVLENYCRKAVNPLTLRLKGFDVAVVEQYAG